jgi:hypothetical protein
VSKIWQRGDRLGFESPGCGVVHEVPVVCSPGPDAKAWNWNGSLDKPTLHPSLKVTNGQGFCCHFWVKNGTLEFLHDCTHGLRNKTVAMPEAPA